MPCGGCRHFRNDADYLERTFAGLTAMSSGRGAVRAGDGLCSRHSLYLGRDAWCDEFVAEEESAVFFEKMKQKTFDLLLRRVFRW